MAVTETNLKGITENCRQAIRAIGPVATVDQICVWLAKNHFSWTKTGVSQAMGRLARQSEENIARVGGPRSATYAISMPASKRSDKARRVTKAFKDLSESVHSPSESEQRYRMSLQKDMDLPWNEDDEAWAQAKRFKDWFDVEVLDDLATFINMHWNHDMIKPIKPPVRMDEDAQVLVELLHDFVTRRSEDRSPKNPVDQDAGIFSNIMAAAEIMGETSFELVGTTLGFLVKEYGVGERIDTDKETS